MVELIVSLIICIIGRILCVEYANEVMFLNTLSNVLLYLIIALVVVLVAMIVAKFIKYIRK